MREHRLGLALSGGGFRASLFHLGVLRRLAELGLLRQVTQLSTVSGGSIVAALYYLHFKRAFEGKNGELTNDDYVKVVKDVEVEFCKGVKKDIRNRLLAAPIAHLRELTFGNGFGRRIARLYNAHFYGRVIKDIFKGDPNLKTYLKRGVPLHKLITRLPGQSHDGPFPNRSSGYPGLSEPEQPLVDFNEDDRYANIPSVVLNATCLNTGGPFYFTLNEIGGPECGFLRTDEVFLLCQYKYLLESIGDVPIDAKTHEQFLNGICDLALQYGAHMEKAAPALPQTAFHHDPDKSPLGCFPEHTVRHFSFYQAIRARLREGLDFTGNTWVPKEYEFHAGDEDLQKLTESRYWDTVRHLYDVNFGQLRRAKVAAWILLDRAGWREIDGFRGGFTRAEYEAQLVRALEEIDDAFSHDLLRDGKVPEGIAWFIVVLYYFRSAVVLNKKAFEALDRITLSESVAASANFPPMFTPFKINELFESKHMEAVHLTDGGVHDNQGIEWLLDSGCTHIIVSDAGGLVPVQQSPSESRLPMMDRIIDVLMGGVRRVLLRSVRETLRISDLLAEPVITTDLRARVEAHGSTRLKMATMFHMTSHPRDAGTRTDDTPLKPFAPELVAALRTDLDAFNDLEIAALRHQGYQLADRFTREMAALPEFELGDPPRAVSPSLPPALDQHHIRVLTAGASRIARYSVAYPLQSALVATAIAGIVSFFAATMDDWSSWHSVQTFISYDASRHLPDDRVPLYESMSGLRPWQAMRFAREVLIDAVAHTSIVTVLFIAWALFLVGREMFRASDAVRDRVQVQLERWVRPDRTGALLRLLKRPANLISLVTIALALSTLHPKWLLGVVHLWAFPIAAFFFFVHCVFTRLWLDTGRIDSPPAVEGDSFAGTPPFTHDKEALDL